MIKPEDPDAGSIKTCKLVSQFSVITVKVEVTPTSN
jgi:hypothetical protein